MGTAIEHTVPDQVKPSIVIFNIRTLWCWALAQESVPIWQQWALKG